MMAIFEGHIPAAPDAEDRHQADALRFDKAAGD